MDIQGKLKAGYIERASKKNVAVVFNLLYEAGFKPCSDGRRYCQENHLRDLLIAQLGCDSRGFSVAQLGLTNIWLKK